MSTTEPIEACPNCDAEGPRTRPDSTTCQWCGDFLPASSSGEASSRPSPPSPTATAQRAVIADDPFGLDEIEDLMASPRSISPRNNLRPSQPTTDLPASQPTGHAYPAAPPPDEVLGLDPQTQKAEIYLTLESPPLAIPVPAGSGVLLGRDPESPIATHPSVTKWTSSKHARVELAVGDTTQVLVTDTGSTNGTRLAGMRLQPWVKTAARPGDTIQLCEENLVRITIATSPQP